MQTDYEMIFRHRGGSYHQAMVKFPGVREKEFKNLFAAHPLKGGEAVIDCPSLGGYLQRFVDVPVRLINLDFCPVNGSAKEITQSDWGVSENVDRVVCLAASHHINDIKGFVQKACNNLKKGGFIHLADVTNESPLKDFLDGFVGKWTSTGHKGIWRDFSSLVAFVERSCPLLAISVRECDCPWVFPSRVELLEFCRLLFGLDLNPSDEEIWEALEKSVGIQEDEEKITILWKLSYIDFRKWR